MKLNFYDTILKLITDATNNKTLVGYFKRFLVALSIGIVGYVIATLLILLIFILMYGILFLINLYGTYGLILTIAPLTIGSVSFLAILLYLLV